MITHSNWWFCSATSVCIKVDVSVPFLFLALFPEKQLKSNLTGENKRLHPKMPRNSRKGGQNGRWLLLLINHKSNQRTFKQQSWCQLEGEEDEELTCVSHLGGFNRPPSKLLTNPGETGGTANQSGTAHNYSHTYFSCHCCLFRG